MYLKCLEYCKMLIGNVSYTDEYFKGWTYEQFEEYYKRTGKAQYGVKCEQVAKMLGIEIPKAKEAKEK
jgi:hypothetical protein